MSKLNKIITNQPVVLTEEEVNNLSETLSAVRTAGGGEGGHLYTGDNKYIGVDNGNYKIKFLDTAAEKLESISSKLDKTEAANTYLTSADAQTLYQTKEAMSAYATTAYVNGVTGSIYYTNILGLVDALSAKQDKLTFGYDENDAISSINNHEIAGTGGVTGDYYSASNPSGFINSAQAETQILEKHYLTEASGDSLYVPIPEGLSDGQYYAMTTSSWKVIQGAGDVSGISTVAHDDTLTGNGNNENLGVDITKIQTKLTDAQIQNITDVTTLKTASSTWDKVSDKIDTTAAAQTYQPKGDYLSSNALEGYATTALLDTISSKIENDIPTKVSDLTDSANYYKTTETSGKNELSTEFAKYLTTSQYNTDSATFALKTDLNDLVSSAGVTTTDTDYVMTTTGWKVLTLPGGGMTQVIHDTTLTGQGNANDSKLGVAWDALSGNTIASALSAGSATSAYWSVKAKYGEQREFEIGKNLYNLTQWQTALVNWTDSIAGYSGIEVLDIDEDGYPEAFQLTDTAYSAVQFVTANSDKLVTSSSNTITGTKQYALTTTGWSAISIPTIPAITATSGISADGYSIGLTNTAIDAITSVSSKLEIPTAAALADKYLVYSTNASNSGWCELSAGDYLHTSGGTVSGELVVSGGSNFDSQFLKITRENVTGYGRIGLGSLGPLALKVDDANQHTTQVNINPNTTNDQLVQVQHNGSQVGFLIPAVTSTTTAGLTNDGILHIILES